MTRLLSLAALVCFLAVPLLAAGEPSALKLGIDSMFIRFQKDFDKVVASSAIKKKAVDPVNRLFFNFLKKHQPYYSFLRTNQKGIVVNEVIRLVEKPSTKKQDVSKEAWFKRVSTKMEPFQDCLFQNETGRYHLFWVAPVISKGKTGKEAFAGAVAVKIDLWDCFHQFSKDQDIPFLIKMDKKSLYSNKWDNNAPSAKEPLVVPGVDKIYVRYPKEGAPAEAQIEAVDSSLIKAAADSAKAAQAKQGKGSKRAVILFIVLLAVIAGVAFKVISARNEKARQQKLDSEYGPLDENK